MNARWLDVITDPVGFAGFALFLIATIVTRVKAKGFFDQRTKTGLFIVGLVCLIGGLGLAYARVQYTRPGLENLSKGDITQRATECSNAVVAGGNVTVSGDRHCPK